MVCRHTLEGHGGWVSDCAITAASDTAITVSGDDLAVVWDILSGGCKNVLEGHSGEVLSVVLTKRGRFAVTGAPPLCSFGRIQALAHQSTADSTSPRCQTSQAEGRFHFFSFRPSLVAWD